MLLVPPSLNFPRRKQEDDELRRAPVLPPSFDEEEVVLGQLRPGPIDLSARAGARPPQILTGHPIADEAESVLPGSGQRLAGLFQDQPDLRYPRADISSRLARLQEIKDTPRSSTIEKLIAGLGLGTSIVGALAGNPALAQVGGIGAQFGADLGAGRAGRLEEERQRLEGQVETFEEENRRAARAETQANFARREDDRQMMIRVELARVEAARARREGRLDEAREAEAQIAKDERTLENRIRLQEELDEQAASRELTKKEKADLDIDRQRAGTAAAREGRLSSGGGGGGKPINPATGEPVRSRQKVEAALEDVELDIQTSDSYNADASIREGLMARDSKLLKALAKKRRLQAELAGLESLEGGQEVTSESEASRVVSSLNPDQRQVLRQQIESALVAPDDLTFEQLELFEAMLDELDSQ